MCLKGIFAPSSSRGREQRAVARTLKQLAVSKCELARILNFTEQMRNHDSRVDMSKYTGVKSETFHAANSIVTTTRPN